LKVIWNGSTVLTAGQHHFTAVNELWFVQTETQHTHFSVCLC